MLTIENENEFLCMENESTTYRRKKKPTQFQKVPKIPKDQGWEGNGCVI